MILAGILDGRIVVVHKHEDGTETQLESMDADGAERLARAILQTVPRQRELEAKISRKTVEKEMAETEAAHKEKMTELRKRAAKATA